jgi:DNA-binding NarL/FixJ family response regulator
VRSALAGDVPLPPRLALSLLEEFARLMNQPANTPASVAASLLPPELTTREREILEYLASGAADKEIAARLSLSLHTVKTHVRNILSKLQAVNRRQAADVARREGWVKKK